jgi:hypothetical protein
LNNTSTVTKQPPSTDLAEDRLAAAGTSLRNGLVFVAMLLALGLLISLVRQGGRPAPDMSDHDIEQSLHHQQPVEVLQALMQVERRIDKREPAAQFYPDVLRLASSSNEDVRHTVAHLMGKDPSRPDFRAALLNMLHEPSLLVRNAAALSLSSFGDGAGREQIIALLQPAVVVAPHAGRVTSVLAADSSIDMGKVVAQIADGGNTIPVRAPIAGRVTMDIEAGDVVSAGVRVGVIEPSSEQVMIALQALQRVGANQDILLIQNYVSKRENLPLQLLEEAKATERAIRARR